MSVGLESQNAVAPPASLMAVQIRRRSLPAQASGKPGDITHRLVDIPLPEQQDASAAASACPPVLELDRIEEAIPLSDAVPPELPVVAEPSSTAPRGSVRGDVVDYWRSLRGGRAFPSPADLDPALFSSHWPDSMLLTYMPASIGAGQTPAVAKVSRLGLSNDATGESEIEYTPLITEWILSLGRDVVRGGEAFEEYGRFPTRNGTAGYRIVAMPMSSGADRPDHVLCRLVCTDTAPRFGRHRTRLAS